MATPRALALHAGPEARERLLDEGLKPEQFGLLVGASGGAKWLVLSALDRVLFPWLMQARSTPLACVGSSIGAWRHLCLVQDDPAAATTRFENAYIEQHYEARPTPEHVSAVARGILRELLGKDGARRVSTHPFVCTHIVAARARAPWRVSSKPALLAAATATALGNLLHRGTLEASLERGCFHTGDAAGALRFPRLGTRYLPLTDANVTDAAMASGSIPLVSAGVDTLMPGEVFWDGGMTDYHFGPGLSGHEGLALYPHFYPHFAPGWFDKALPWRRQRAAAWPGLVLLCPTPEFVRSLPGGRVPERGDFSRFSTEERQRRWRAASGAAVRLAEEFGELVTTRQALERALVAGPH